MRQGLLIIAAAALIAGPAPAQTQKNEGSDAAPGRAPAAIRNAPAEKIAPPAGRTTGEGPQAPAAGRQIEPESRSHNADKPATRTQSQGQAQDTPARAGDSGKTGSSATTGQGAAGTSANFTSEQRSKIKTVIREQNIRPVTNVSFSLTIGTTVPRDVQLHPLPVAVIDLYPAWRGYEFILVGDEIVVIDPATLRIVAIIEA